jgi:3-deoxy-7-phosphoheptulonate synthase
MRVYFAKPRTVTGWKGLINGPGMDGSIDVHRGLRTARRLLLDILGSGSPARRRVIPNESGISLVG